jgi:hypothetical protein
MIAALDDTEEKRDSDEFVVKKVMIMSGLNINKKNFHPPVVLNILS